MTVDVQDITAPEIKITTTGETSEVSFKAEGGTDPSRFALTFFPHLEALLRRHRLLAAS